MRRDERILETCNDLAAYLLELDTAAPAPDPKRFRSARTFRAIAQRLLPVETAAHLKRGNLVVIDRALLRVLIEALQVLSHESIEQEQTAILTKLREHMKSRRVSIQALANRLDLPRTTLSCNLRGQGLTLERLLQVCDALQITIRDLLGGNALPQIQKQVNRELAKSPPSRPSSHAAKQTVQESGTKCCPMCGSHLIEYSRERAIDYRREDCSKIIWKLGKCQCGFWRVDKFFE